MKFKLNFLKKSEFNKNVFSLFKGAFLAQIIGALGAIILAKLYGNEAYGVFNIFLSLSGILTVLFTLNFEQAIVVTKKDVESKNIFNSLFFVTVLLSVIFFTIILIGKLLIPFFNTYFLVLIVSSIGALLLAQKNIIEMFLTRVKSFRIQSKTRILTAILTILFQSILIFYFAKNGLIYGFLLSLVLVLSYLIFHLKNYFEFPSFFTFRKQLSKYKNLIKFGFPSNFINGLANNILPLLIAAFFSLASTGVYSLSLKIVLAPMLLLSASFAQVYFQKASYIYHESPQKLHEFTKKIVINNVWLMFIFLIFINTIGIYLLELFFDKQWENLRIYVLILSFYILCRVSFNPISYLITILDRFQIGLMFNIYLIIINLISIYLGYLYQDLLYTVLFFSVFSGLGYLFLLFNFLKKLKVLL